PDVIERLEVSDRVGPGCPADRLLVNQSHTFYMFDSLDGFEATHRKGFDTESTSQCPVERVFNERALARAGHAGDADQHPEGEPHGQVVEVVFARSGDPQDFAGSRASGLWQIGMFFTSQIRAVSARPSCKNSWADAAQTISPPFSPDCGPNSTIWSADSIIWRSCSTTTTVFPTAARSLRIPASRSVSRAWRPIVGSSRTYSVTTRRAPS